MKKLFFIFLFSPAILINITFAHPLTWQKLYDTPDHVNNYCYDACDALNGNFFISGFTDQKFNLYKINQYGNVIWNLYVNGLQSQPRSIVSSGDGGCVIIGLGSRSMKIDSIGNIVWQKNYNSNPQLWDIEKTSDGGYIACGTVAYRQWYILKIDLNGDFQWDRTGPVASWAVFYSGIEANGSGFVFYGTYSDSNFNGYGLALKVDNNGNTNWQKLFTTSEMVGDTYGSVVAKTNTAYFFGGNAAINGPSQIAYAIKTNLNGDSIGILKNSFPRLQVRLSDFKIINDNKFAYSVVLDTETAYNYSKIIFCDSTGQVIRQKEFRGVMYSTLELRSILLLPDGGILSAGYADYFNKNNFDAFAVKTDSTLNAPPPIGIIKISNEVPHDFILHPNYPNPFNSSTLIKFSLSKKGLIELLIFDLKGELIDKLIREELNPGEYKVNWNANNNASGVYFLTMNFQSNIIKTHKMLLIK